MVIEGSTRHRGWVQPMDDAPDGRSATNWTDTERYDSRGCQYQQGPTPVYRRKGEPTQTSYNAIR